MENDVPLVVPEVNPKDVDWNNGIIANPNCSTIQSVVPLTKLHEALKIKKNSLFYLPSCIRFWSRWYKRFRKWN